MEYNLDNNVNIEGKGENAAQQQFLLFPQCFWQLSLWRSRKVGIMWVWVNSISPSMNDPEDNKKEQC